MWHPYTEERMEKLLLNHKTLLHDARKEAEAEAEKMFPEHMEKERERFIKIETARRYFDYTEWPRCRG